MCCVAPAFDAEQGFGYDKAAHEPCIHLQTSDRCAIHAQLAGRGFPGCVQFTCHGAGQRITQQFFSGRHWRDSPASAREIFDAYSRLLRLHELMAMLAWAEPRAPAGHARQRLVELRLRIDSACPAAVEGQGGAAIAGLREETMTLLREALPRPPGVRTRSSP